MPADGPERDTEPHEGPEAARRFKTAMARILSVPKSEIVKREAAYQEQRKQKPRTRRPGPR